MLTLTPLAATGARWASSFIGASGRLGGAPLVGLLLALPAAADDTHQLSENHIDGQRFDVHANFGGYGSLGAGVRIDIPLVSHGLIVGVDDELALSPGLDVFFTDFYPDRYDGGPYLVPSVVAQWNFYIQKWSLFPEAGVAIYVAGERRSLPGDRSVYIAPDFGIGARYHFSPRNALLLRISTPTGFQVGLTF